MKRMVKDKPLFKDITDHGLSWWKRVTRMVKNSLPVAETRFLQNCPYCGKECKGKTGLDRHIQHYPECGQAFADDPQYTSDFDDDNGGSYKGCPFEVKTCDHGKAKQYKRCKRCRLRYGETALHASEIIRANLRARCVIACEKAQGAKHIPHEKWKRSCLKGNKDECAFPKLRIEKVGAFKGWCQHCTDAVNVKPEERRFIKKQ